MMRLLILMVLTGVLIGIAVKLDRIIVLLEQMR